MTKKELITALISGKKMTSDSFGLPDEAYCMYDDNFSNPFRLLAYGDNSPMKHVWELTDWREVKEEPSFEPKDGEEWWCVDVAGSDYSIVYGDSTYDNDMKNQNRLFKTSKEAAKFSEWEQASYRLRKRIWELNGNKNRGFLKGQHNYFVESHYTNSDIIFKIEHYSRLKSYPSWFYLESKELAQQLMDEMSEDLKTYLKY